MRWIDPNDQDAMLLTAAPDPRVGRVVDWLPYRAHRIKALGNGQVPRMAAAAFAALSGR